MLKFVKWVCDVCSKACGAEAKFSQWQPSAEASCQLFCKIHFAGWISFACSKYRPKTGKAKSGREIGHSNFLL